MQDLIMSRFLYRENY